MHNLYLHLLLRPAPAAQAVSPGPASVPAP